MLAHISPLPRHTACKQALPAHSLRVPTLLPYLSQVQSRLCNEAWRRALRPDHMLRVLQCIRLLSRDMALRQRFVDVGAVKVCR